MARNVNPVLLCSEGNKQSDLTTRKKLLVWKPFWLFEVQLDEYGMYADCVFFEEGDVQA